MECEKLKYRCNVRCREPGKGSHVVEQRCLGKLYWGGKSWRQPGDWPLISDLKGCVHCERVAKFFEQVAAHEDHMQYDPSYAKKWEYLSTIAALNGIEADGRSISALEYLVWLHTGIKYAERT